MIAFCDNMSCIAADLVLEKWGKNLQSHVKENNERVQKQFSSSMVSQKSYLEKDA